MIDIDAVKARVSDIMHRFPSMTGTITRPGVDDYGQPTDEDVVVGTLPLWWKTPDTGSGFGIEEKGQTFAEDGARWACALVDDMPAYRRGDKVTIGGERYRIANTQPRMARIFLQLIYEGDAT